MDIREDIKAFLELNNYENVVVDRFRATLKNVPADIDQIIISDMPDGRKPLGSFVYSKIAIGVKRQSEKSARDICEEIEFLLAEKGGKLIGTGTDFDRIKTELKTTFVGFNNSDNTAIYECQLQFIYSDINNINNYL